MKKRNIIFLVMLITIGFASVATTLVINGLVKLNFNHEDFNVIFTRAYFDTGEGVANITQTTKEKDTIEFTSPLLTMIDEAVTLNYTVKNNSTQYEADAAIKCYAEDDENGIVDEYLNLSGEFASIPVVFKNNATDATLTEVVKMNALEEKTGSITMSLKKGYVGTKTENETNVSIKCEIVVNPVESSEAAQRPITKYGSGVASAFNELTNVTEDYKTLSKNMFVREIGDINSVCIMIDENPVCFDTGDAGYSEVLAENNGFGCDVGFGSKTDCYGEKYTCQFYWNGKVSCYEPVDGDLGEGCSISNWGSIDCN